MDHDRYDVTPQKRSVEFVDIDTAADGSSFDGYAAVFDQEANLGAWTEQVERGAFRKVLAQQANVPMLWNHNPDWPLATTRAGTLELSEDTKGLRVKATLADHFIGDMVRELVRRGDVSGMSYGFVAGPGNSHFDEQRTPPHRTLKGFTRLLDVSPTWDPAFDQTEAEIRSLIQTFSDSPARLQELVAGEHQQSDDAAAGREGANVEEEPEQRSGEGDVSGVTPRVAAARRRLSIMHITLKEGTP
jgi:uncharacterized protein